MEKEKETHKVKKNTWEFHFNYPLVIAITNFNGSNFFILIFLAMLKACQCSQAKDQIHTTATT